MQDEKHMLNTADKKSDFPISNGNSSEESNFATTIELTVTDKAEDDFSLKWAVVGYNRANFSEEFIASHPMDFYETEEDISGVYDIYLMNEHGHYTPSIEFRNSKGVGFKSALTFLGTAPNHAGEGDFRLKHLRMLFGMDDYSFYPFDFADVCQVLGDKDLTIDARSFSSEDSVENIIKWIRGIGKEHHIKDQEIVIVFEGDNLTFAAELSEKISECFCVRIGILAVYSENVDSEVMNISLCWYETVSDIRNLRNRWDRYYEGKFLYASGEKEIDMDDYCELVEKTWWYLRRVKHRVEDYLSDNSHYVEVDRTEVLSFFEYVKMMQRLTYYSVRPDKDQSKDYIYTVTAMLADELARLACGKEFGTPSYNFYGEFTGLHGIDMDVTLAAPHPGSDKRVYYSTSEKNYQVLFEAAKRLNEEEAGK